MFIVYYHTTSFITDFFKQVSPIFSKKNCQPRLGTSLPSIATSSNLLLVPVPVPVPLKFYHPNIPINSRL